jgi:hypothetical protein
MGLVVSWKKSVLFLMGILLMMTGIQVTEASQIPKGCCTTMTLCKHLCLAKIKPSISTGLVTMASGVPFVAAAGIAFMSEHVAKSEFSSSLNVIHQFQRLCHKLRHWEFQDEFRLLYPPWVSRDQRSKPWGFLRATPHEEFPSILVTGLGLAGVVVFGVGVGLICLNLFMTGVDAFITWIKLRSKTCIP